MQDPPLTQSDQPSTIEINSPTSKEVPHDESSNSRGGIYNLRPSLNPNYSEF